MKKTEFATYLKKALIETQSNSNIMLGKAIGEFIDKNSKLTNYRLVLRLESHLKSLVGQAETTFDILAGQKGQHIDRLGLAMLQERALTEIDRFGFALMQVKTCFGVDRSCETCQYPYSVNCPNNISLCQRWQPRRDLVEAKWER